MSSKKTYTVESYDSYDAPDERTSILRGEFDTYEEALIFSKSMVEDFIRQQIESGKNAEDAARAFRYGAEVPMILGNSENDEHFQPYEYADKIAIEIIKGRS